MRRIILIFAVLIFWASSSFATHLMGGDITMFKNASGKTIVKLTYYRDVAGVQFSPIAQGNVYKYDSVALSWLLVGSTTPNLVLDSSATLLLPGVPYGVERYVFYDTTGAIDLLFTAYGPGLYRVNSTDCCRNTAIQNLTTPDSEFLIISCEYNYTGVASYVNSLPEFLNLPIVYGPVNLPWVYNPLPYDADGDSLVWSIGVPKGYGVSSAVVACAGYVAPSSIASGIFSLNSANGQLDWTPSTLGHFVASFLIEEYRNGTRIGSTERDMQYIVVPDSTLDSNGLGYRLPRFAPVANVNSATGANGDSLNFINYSPGNLLTFDIFADDENTADQLSMSAFSSLLHAGVSNASFSYAATGIGNQTKGVFNWTPSANDQENKIIVIRANDGRFSKDFSITLVRKDIQTAIIHSPVTDNLVSVYPNPTAQQVIRFSISNARPLNNVYATIVDVTGQVMVSKAIGIINSGTHTCQIDKALNPGNYLLHITDGLQRITTVKFSAQ